MALWRVPSGDRLLTSVQGRWTRYPEWTSWYLFL